MTTVVVLVTALGQPDSWLPKGAKNVRRDAKTFTEGDGLARRQFVGRKFVGLKKAGSREMLRKISA